MFYRNLKPLLTALLTLCASVALHAQMAQDPLLSRTAAVEPNIVLMFDDSGSMVATDLYQFGGQAGGYGMTGPGATLTVGNTGCCTRNQDILTTNTWVTQSPDVNLIYYDPRVLYKRRINADGTFQAAGTSPSNNFNVFFYKPPVTTIFSVSSVTSSTLGSGYPASGVTATFSAPPAGGTLATGNVVTASRLNVASVGVTAGGSGYPASGVTATFSAAPAGGVTATGTVNIGSTFTPTSVTVNSGGANYPSSGTTATFSAPPTGGTTATGTVQVSSVNTLQIGSVLILTAGSGYSSGVTNVGAVVISAPQLATGVQATAIVARNAGRGIASITITNPGSGYTSTPTITLTGGGGGSGATFLLTMTNAGRIVTGITMTSAGSGYASAPTVTVAGGSGSGAAVTVNGTTSRFVSAINITNPGSGYTSAPTVALGSTGAGAGASFTVATGVSNVITGITVTGSGSGYPATPTITLGNTGGGSGASFVVNTAGTLSPQPANRKWDGSDTPTALLNYFNPSYLPDSGSALTAGANAALTYPNNASSSTSNYPKFSARADCVASTTSCTWTEELQNYANWYTYHRTRMDLAKTGMGLAFQPLNPTFRLGWGTINRLNNNSSLDSGVQLYDSTTRDRLMTWLYGLNINGGTPNRIALDKVGQYYQRADDGGPWATTPPLSTPASVNSAAAENLTHAGCRRSYALLMTDGYYNETFSLSDVDTHAQPSITQGGTFTYQGNTGPYSDTIDGGTAFSNSFADVAMKYWVADLRPNIPNIVRPAPGDNAFWQHLNFYAIGLGVLGTLDSTDPAVLGSLTGTSASLPARTLNWPPTPTTDTPATIDDMWHATVNGHGKMLSATNSAQLNNAITQLMAAVSSAPATQSGVAVSTASLRFGTKKYTPQYRAVTWNGNVTAFKLDPVTGNENGTAWQIETLVSTDPVTGAQTFSSIIPQPDTRNILVGNGASSGVRAVPFTFAAMSAAGLTSSMNGTVNANLINYLRGDRTNEASPSTISPTAIYRPRNTRPGDVDLGDIVNSTPVFVKDTVDLSYDNLPAGTPGKDTYRDYVDGAGTTPTGGKKQRAEGVLFVGANDGMLHGFRDGTYDPTTLAAIQPGGIETFAFVPKAILPTLNQLANQPYTHRYFVDGPNIETDAYFSGGWTNVLVGTTGAGAGAPGSPGVSPRTGVYAIDVTSLNSGPTTMGASNVLWEISSSNTNFQELGYVLTDVQAGPTLDGSWVAIFGNGYESASCQARLFVVNLQTGALIREINTNSGNCSSAKNGLGGARIVRNANQQIIGVYAGDLLGNMWKFSLNDSNPSNWKVDLATTALFAAGSTKPITAAPTVLTLTTTGPAAVGKPVGGYMVVFGTGKFYEVGDITTTTQQSLYGIWDPVAFGASTIPSGTALSNTSLLVPQTISTINPTTTNGNTFFSVSTNAVDYLGNMPTVAPRRGWFIDFPNSGQRLVYPLDLLAGRFVAADTISPANVSLDPCSNVTGGTGFLYFIDALTGSGPASPILDTNGDGHIDTLDLPAAGLAGAADGRNVSLLVDQNASRTNYVNVSGGSPSGTLISISCTLLGTCVQPVVSPVRTREWRQLFLR